MGRIILNSGWIYDVEIMDLVGDYETTRWIEFAEDENNIWALVLHCVDEDIYDVDNNNSITAKRADVIYGKLAYCPKNSLMHEYDIDWIMPELVEGVVYDTEYDIPEWADRRRVLLTLKDWEDGMNEIVKKLGLEI